jgi:dienelactone hydrolase
MHRTCQLLAAFLLSVSGSSFAQSLTDRIADNHLAFIPDGTGPFPTLVAMPGCSGISTGDPEAEASNPSLHADDLLFRRHFPYAAKKMKAEGFAVLLINVHTAEGLLTACGGKIASDRLAEYVDSAITWAKQQPYVDPENIHVIGWSMGGRAVLTWLDGPRSEAQSVRSTITVYPSCPEGAELSIPVPLLMLLGGADDIALPSTCEALVQAAPIKQHVTMVNYPEARHGFDIVDAPPVLECCNGKTIGYQQAAADAAWQAIFEFLGASD